MWTGFPQKLRNTVVWWVLSRFLWSQVYPSNVSSCVDHCREPRVFTVLSFTSLRHPVPPPCRGKVATAEGGGSRLQMRAFAVAIFLAEVFNPACNAMPARQAEPSELCSYFSLFFSFFSRPAGYHPFLPRRLCHTRVFFWRDRSFCQVLAAYKIFARIVFAYLHITRHDKRFVCRLCVSWNDSRQWYFIICLCAPLVYQEC